ncbi:MAG TPA: DUF1178 family protein [Acidiferrobacterales bacterium]|nr:DUF1178 family protein [Acidiferrobacterales bacterium]
MIIYDLVCDAQHQFEGWFKNADEYATQLSGGLLSCPICSSAQVHKVLSVSHVNTAPGTQPTDMELTAEARPQELLKKLHEYIEQSFDNVGTQFAEEARKIHYGETEERNIYGQATGIEIKELRAEGINAVPLPAKPTDESKLN